MCGRFTFLGRAKLLTHKLGLADIDLPPRYNIAPTQYCGVVLQEPGKNPEFHSLYWGLIPSWAKDMRTAAMGINARADTVGTKPMFRQAFRERRCLVPASGFYEWHKHPDGKVRTPYYFSAARTEEPLVFAGLWETWNRMGQEIWSFSIITTEANPVVSPVHSRMPVILPPERWLEWLDPAAKTRYLADLLEPADVTVLQSWQVSPHVNNVRNDCCQCIEKV